MRRTKKLTVLDALIVSTVRLRLSQLQKQNKTPICDLCLFHFNISLSITIAINLSSKASCYNQNYQSTIFKPMFTKLCINMLILFDSVIA